MILTLEQERALVGIFNPPAEGPRIADIEVIRSLHRQLAERQSVRDAFAAQSQARA